jgi:hypothetical protein
LKNKFRLCYHFYLTKQKEGDKIVLQRNTGQNRMWSKTTNNKPQTVRCNGCGRAIEKDKAYCVIKGPQKLYYCSKEEYEGGEEYIAKRNEYEEGTLRAVKNIVCYDQNKDEYSFNASLYNTLLAEWLQSASPKKVYYYLTYEEDRLRNILIRKEIERISGRLKYLSAILINSISDYDIRRPGEDFFNKTKAQQEGESLDKTKIQQKGEFSNKTKAHSDYCMAYQPRLTPRENLRRSLEELEDKYGD